MGEPDASGAKIWYRDRPMRELHQRTYDAYRALYARMLDEVRSYVERVILGQPLAKAGPPVPPKLLTPAELEAIRALILSHHEAFIAHVIGPRAVDPAILQQLAQHGLLRPDMAGVSPAILQQLVQQGAVVTEIQAPTKIIDEAYRYGQHLGSAATPREKRPIEGLTWEEWKQRPVPPPSPAEQHAIDFARQSAATRIRGLGNRVADDFTTTAIEADRALRHDFEAVVRDKVAENVEKRDSWRKITSELGDATGDWSRDLGRIAATEKMDAMIEGQAQAIVERSDAGPDEVRVAKQPNPDACPECLHHYLADGKPRIFVLSALTANGSNAGRKKKDWLPTLGPLHPWCACELIEVPSGWGFDDEGNLEPLVLKRSDLEWNLIKSLKRRMFVMTYGDAVGDAGITVRIADPLVREAVEAVVARTPVEVFTRATGVTLITTDHGRPQNPMDENDFAYWAGNEIRIQQTIDPAKVKRVLEHEIGHSLNSWLLTTFGDIPKVREWHEQLWQVSQREAWVSAYAKKAPIENAAEVSRFYLYYKPLLRQRFPSQFAMVHRAYRGMFCAKMAPRSS